MGTMFLVSRLESQGDNAWHAGQVKHYYPIVLMGSLYLTSKMGVPEAVLEKVGSMPDVSAMSKDDLAALCKSLYDRSCIVFGEKFDEEYQVKKRYMEIHNLEMETSESHGTFKIPKLKKVNKFKAMEGEHE